MSKQYTLDYNLNTDKYHPTGGFLMKQKPDGTIDGQRTGAEVFTFLVGNAISGANKQVSYEQLKNFRRVAKNLEDNVEKGTIELNKTDLDIIKGSVRGNPYWPNTDQMELVLDDILAAVDGVVECKQIVLYAYFYLENVDPIARYHLT